MIRCPVCRSIEIYRVAGGCIGEVYRCKRCGYTGSFMVEEDEPARNTEEKS
jgi:transposase-like protein